MSRRERDRRHPFHDTSDARTSATSEYDDDTGIVPETKTSARSEYDDDASIVPETATESVETQAQPSSTLPERQPFSHIKLSARLYARKYRWPVFPCLPESEMPMTPNGYLDATTDLAQIDRWWASCPEANVAVAIEQAKLIVIVVDPDSGGDETLAALIEEHGKLPKTVIISTGGYGRYYCFLSPGGAVKDSLGPGVEIRSVGFILFPWSIHPNGTPFAWVRRPAEMKNERPLNLPRAWIKAIRKEREKASKRANPGQLERRVRALEEKVAQILGQLVASGAISDVQCETRDAVATTKVQDVSGDKGVDRPTGDGCVGNSGDAAFPKSSTQIPSRSSTTDDGDDLWNVVFGEGKRGGYAERVRASATAHKIKSVKRRRSGLAG